MTNTDAGVQWEGVQRVAPPHRTSTPKVVLVEDDESHLLAITLGLEREGFSITAVNDGREAMPTIARINPDIILLDIMLPGLSGLEICRQLRANGVRTPIIMVSARSDEVDVVLGIELGADGYVAKPYRIRELAARINAVLRRRQSQLEANQTPRTAPSTDVLQIGDLVLDSARHELFVRGERIEIPLREFQLLRELMDHAGRVVTREELIDNVWGYSYEGDPRIIATLVGRLRAKIETDPDTPTHIITIRGVGYRFNDRYH